MVSHPKACAGKRVSECFFCRSDTRLLWIQGLNQVFHGSLGYDMPAVLARARPHIYNKVCRAERILIMFHNNQRIAQVTQVFERLEQPRIVSLVKPDGRFIQDIQHAYQTGTNLGGQADTLRLTAG